MVVLNQHARLNNVRGLGFSVPEFQDYRDQNKTMQSMIKYQQVDPGFNPENVFVMRLQPNWSRFSDPATVTAQYRNYFRRLLEVSSEPSLLLEVESRANADHRTA